MNDTLILTRAHLIGLPDRDGYKLFLGLAETEAKRKAGWSHDMAPITHWAETVLHAGLDAHHLASRLEMLARSIREEAEKR